MNIKEIKMEFVKQCKGKDLAKVPANKLLKRDYYIMPKYDGNYVQIHKSGSEVKFFTSSGEEFYLPNVARKLIKDNEFGFRLECEFIGKTDGKLGSRGKCTTTTFRTDFKKGLVSNDEGVKFIVFDILSLQPFQGRRETLEECIVFNDQVELCPLIAYGEDLDEAERIANMYCNDGWEGVFLKHRNHFIHEGKRVNDAIKIKGRHTADLLCIDYIEGKGKYEGMIGSLVLQDSKGRLVRVGSGLDDLDRLGSPDKFIGKVVEIKYEQLQDTYIQPVYVGIRDDKDVKDID